MVFYIVFLYVILEVGGVSVLELINRKGKKKNKKEKISLSVKTDK